MVRQLVACVLALAVFAGGAQAGRSGKAPSLDGIKRVSMNLGGPGGQASGIFINHLQEGNGWPSPFNGFVDGTHVWYGGILDASGMPNTATTQSFGGGSSMPSSANNPGPFCFDGIDTGSGSTFTLNGTWTVTASVTCAHLAANGKPDGTTVTCPNTAASWTQGTQTVAVTGQSAPGYWCLAMTSSGWTVNSSQQVNVTQSDGTLTAMAYYLSSDAADRAAGKIFRTPWKQTIVTLNPSFIRMLNYMGPGHISADVRWENRLQAAHAGYGQGASYVCQSPPYQRTSGTDQYTLPSVAATGCSPATPVSRLHGELAVFQWNNTATIIGGSADGAGLANCVISAITAGNPTTITTAGACIGAGQTGLQVVLRMENTPTVPSATGTLANLDLFPVTATFVDGTHFTVNFNSSGTFTPCSGTNCYVAVNECLNINSTGCFPIVHASDGYTAVSFLNPGGSAGLLRPQANKYAIAVFDKNSVGSSNGTGTYVKGVWAMYPSTGQVPIEIVVAMVNEINAMYTTQPPTHLYITIPGRALVPTDSDYSAGSDYPQNLYNTIMNGANGYAGLCAKCGLFLEHSNETWDFGFAFFDTTYFAQQGALYWGGANNNGDVSGYSTLRAIQVMSDIKNASAYAANAWRTRFVIATLGATGTQSPNAVRIFGTNGGAAGNTNLPLNDPRNPLRTSTSFTGTISGATLTIQGGTLVGIIAPGHIVMYAGAAPCVVVSGAGLSWTVASNATDAYGANPATPNCTGASGVAMTANPGPMTLFDKVAGAPYIDPGNPTPGGGAATNGVTAAGNNILHFASVPTPVSVGMSVVDQTTPSVIPVHTVITAVGAGTVTISNNATGGGVANGDRINFGYYADVYNGGQDYTACATAQSTSTCNIFVASATAAAVVADITRITMDMLGNTAGPTVAVTPANCGTLIWSNTAACWAFVRQTSAAVIALFGANKEYIDYEGGLDIAANDGNIQGFTNSANFVNLIYSSTDWAVVQNSFFGRVRTTANTALPNFLLQTCNPFVSTSQGTFEWEWGNACPDGYKGTVEGAGFSPNWYAYGAYNAQQGN